MGNFKLVAATVLFSFLTVAIPSPVEVTVYYETLCPYCVEFIVDQLYPGYLNLEDAVQINLNPFGNSKVSQNGSKTIVTCQHGPVECYGDKVHACALQNTTQSASLGFINCTADSPDRFPEVGQRCAEQFNLNWDKIKFCADGEQGEKLILRYGVATRKAHIDGTPTIVFNNVYDVALENLARDNFTEAVCTVIKGEKPEICKIFPPIN